MAWFAAQVFADFGSEPASVWVIPIYTGTGPPLLYPRFDLVYPPLYPRSFSFPPPLGPSLASDIDGDPDNYTPLDAVDHSQELYRPHPLRVDDRVIRESNADAVW